MDASLMQYSRMPEQPTPPPTDRSQSWSRYWATGALHSCVGSFADNYDGEIAAFWGKVFARLPHGARVLDVATGNGALPRLLLDSLPRKGEPDPVQAVEIDAVDLADVAPRWVRTLDPEQSARIRFHCGVRAEALPFADASFGLVISQYGIEYTDLAASAAEVRRVLTANGSVALLLHHVGSLPVRLGRVELVELDWLERPDGLLERAHSLLPFLVELGTPGGMARVRGDPRATAAREAVNQAMRALDVRAAEDIDAAPVLRDLQGNLAALFNASAQLGAFHAQARLNALLAGLAQARLRQQELVGCALDEQQLWHLATELSVGRAFLSKINAISVQGQLFGWGLHLRPLEDGE